MIWVEGFCVLLGGFVLGFMLGYELGGRWNWWARR